MIAIPFDILAILQDFSKNSRMALLLTLAPCPEISQKSQLQCVNSMTVNMYIWLCIVLQMYLTYIEKTNNLN